MTGIVLLIKHYIVCKSVKGYQLPHPRPFQNHPRITRIPPFLKILHPPTLLVNWSSQVFLINRNAIVRLISINTIHVKQQHNIGFSIFKFTLQYMPGNVYDNQIHSRQCLYVISSFCRGFPHPFNFFVASKGILHVQLNRTARKKRFFNGATSN